MEIIRFTKKKEAEIIESTLNVLRSGGVVGFPTETFYGLGVHYANEDALKRLYELKKRPFEKAVPVLIGDMAQLELLSTDVPEEALLLMKKYWPGPLTVVLNAREDLSEYLTAGTGKVAVRMPGESFALILSKESEFPITATSANPSGVPPAEEAVEVLKYFGETIDMVIDDGPTPGGYPSTIVEITEKGLVVHRKGVIRNPSLEG